MESARIVITAEYSQFKTFLDDVLFRLYGRHVKNARTRNGNDFSTHLEYVAFGVIFDYKFLVVEEGLDITLSYWAEVIPDENYENIEIHIENVVQEIRKKFHTITKANMLINKDWDFETAIKEISKVYYPGGKTTGPIRNRQVEAWGQLVGRTRALTEFDTAIKTHGSLSAFGREYSATLSTLRNFREFFESLPNDQVTNVTAESKDVIVPKAFISYSWDNDDHKNWVRELATRLRGDGIDVTLDQWHLVPGDQLPQFMEQAVRESDYVLIICTHKYKERSNNRQGGVGYEGDIITAEFMTTRNPRKFIPILRQQSWTDSAPNWLLGKYHIDLSSSPYLQKYYDDLLTTLLGTREKAPPIGVAPKIAASEKAISNVPKVTPYSNFEEIQITGIIADQVGVPKNDGSHGSALYKIPFRLSQRPSHEWAELFIHNWDHPSRFSTMHRPGIASVVGDTVILDGTTIEEVKDYHRDTLVLILQETNKIYKEFIERKQKAIEHEQEQVKSHKQKVDDINNQIKFRDD